MKDRYRLHRLRNDELLTALSTLVYCENQALSDFLAHLSELDERRLYLSLGHSSLFAYCTEALGLCKSSAGRRIAAARVCRRYPAVFAHVALGELKLSVLCALKQHLTADTAGELFEACQHKSYEQVEELLAARFPKPDVRDLIRRLPARPSSTPHIGSALAAAEVAGVTKPTGVSASRAAPSPSGPQEASRPPASAASNRAANNTPNLHVPPAAGSSKIEPLSIDRFGVHFTADAELRGLIEQAHSLTRHRLRTDDLSSLMKLVFSCFVQHEERRRFSLHVRPRREHVDKLAGTEPQVAVAKADAESKPVTARSSGRVALGGGASHKSAADGGLLRVDLIGFDDRRIDDETVDDKVTRAREIGAQERAGQAALVDAAAISGNAVGGSATRFEKNAIDRDAIDRDAIDRDAIDRDAIDRDAIDRDASANVGAVSQGSAGAGGFVELGAVGLSAVSGLQFGKRGRYISAAGRRAVYFRDGGRCSFVAVDGRRCGARSFLELDHAEPWARLGAAVVENIRLRCRAHNQMHARECFGESHVAAKVTARRHGVLNQKTKCFRPEVIDGKRDPGDAGSRP